MKAPHITGLCLAVALSWSLGAAAQTQTGTQPDDEYTTPGTTGTIDDERDPVGTTGDDPQRHQPGMERMHQVGEQVTLTGCLQRAQEVAEITAPAEEFVLTQATAQPERPVGTVGEEAQPQPQHEHMVGEHGKVYQLTGQREQLQGMVGDRVEVTGTITQLGHEHQQPGQPGHQPGQQPGQTGTFEEPGEGTEAGTATTPGTTTPATPGTDPAAPGQVGTAGMEVQPVATINVTSVREVAGECPSPAGVQQQPGY